MMGRQVDQGALFYEVRLEERVPAGHLLRRIDAILDLGFVRELMAPHYARGGRPSVDPGLLLFCCGCCWWATSTASAPSGASARRST